MTLNLKNYFFVLLGLTFAASAGSANVPLSIESVKTFKLAQPWDYQWEKEKPKVQEATLLVVRGPKEVIEPRQGFEAVILIKDRVAERVRVLDSQRMVMIVPGLVSKSALIWEGPQALPEDIGMELRQRLYQVAKVEQKAQQGLMAKLKESLGISMEAPVPEAQNVSTSADLYQASDALR